jgi:hypothetical protein
LSIRWCLLDPYGRIKVVDSCLFWPCGCWWSQKLCWQLQFLGSGFWELFWISQKPHFGTQISQNPREFHRTQKKPACLRKRRRQHNVVYTYTACLRKRRTQHDYVYCVVRAYNDLVSCWLRYVDRVLTSKTRPP